MPLNHAVTMRDGREQAHPGLMPMRPKIIPLHFSRLLADPPKRWPVPEINAVVDRWNRHLGPSALDGEDAVTVYYTEAGHIILVLTPVTGRVLRTKIVIYPLADRRVEMWRHKTKETFRDTPRLVEVLNDWLSQFFKSW